MNTTYKLIDPSVTILTSVSELKQQLHMCELAGRTCYNSVNKLQDEVSQPFLMRIIDSHHESVLEHAHLTVAFVTDRATTHQLVRHRLASFSQQSQRYCRYEVPDEAGDYYNSHQIAFVKPAWSTDAQWEAVDVFKDQLEAAAKTYQKLLDYKCKPEEARAVLPNCTATVICMTANVREWRHILSERLAPGAQADIKLLMMALRDELIKNGFGYLVEDIKVDSRTAAEQKIGALPVIRCTMPATPEKAAALNTAITADFTNIPSNE